MKDIKEKLKSFFIFLVELKWFKKLLIIVVLALTIYFINNVGFWISGSKYKAVEASEYVNEKKELSSPLEKIKVSNKNVLCAENEKYELGVNPKTTNVYIKSKATGTVWNSLPSTTGMTLYGDEKKLCQANVQLTYEVILNKKLSYSLNSYEDCVSGYSSTNETYTVEKIENGVRLTYNIEKNDISMNYFPVKLTTERMNELFLQRDDDLVDSRMQKLITKSIYEENKETGIWLRKTETAVSNRKALYDLLYNTLGYTIEDLTADNLVFEVETNVSTLPSFFITLDFVLKDDHVELNVPSYGFIDNQVYRIKNVTILPYFSAGPATSTEGYIFVPDGSGALIDYNSYTAAGYYYVKQVYDNDALYNLGYAYSTSKSSNINVPVYGNIDITNGQGMMSIITSGAEMASIVASSSGYMNSQFNKAYTIINYLVQDNVGLYDAYDVNKVILEADDPIYYDYTQNLYFLEGDNANYFQMAKIYQNYLIEKYNITPSFNETPSLDIEAIAGVTVSRKVFGFEYKKEITLTTPSDLLSIANELKNSDVSNIRFTYNGFFNEGLNQLSISKMKLLKSVKKDYSLNELERMLSEMNMNISYAANVLNIYGNKQNGFNRTKEAQRTLDNAVLQMHRYSIRDHSLDQSSDVYYRLSPKYLDNQLKLLRNNYSKNSLSSVTYNDFGREFMADYNRGTIISGIASRNMIDEALENNASINQIYRNPFDYYYRYASYVLDLEYESSNLYCFTETVPFVQLALNGLINYSSGDINNNTIDFTEVSFLKALETSSDIKFLITYQNSTELKNSEYNYIYASDYSNWKDDMISLYSRYESFFNEVGSRVIISHERLDHNVFLVTYSGGKKVVFNYSSIEYVYGGNSVSPNTFMVI